MDSKEGGERPPCRIELQPLELEEDKVNDKEESERGVSKANFTMYVLGVLPRWVQASFREEVSPSCVRASQLYSPAPAWGSNEYQLHWWV